MLEIRQQAYLQAMGISCWESRDKPAAEIKVSAGNETNHWLMGITTAMTQTTEKPLLDIIALMNPGLGNLDERRACIQPVDQLPGYGQQLIFAAQSAINTNNPGCHYLGEFETHIGSSEAKQHLWKKLQTLFESSH